MPYKQTYDLRTKRAGASDYDQELWGPLSQDCRSSAASPRAISRNPQVRAKNFTRLVGDFTFSPPDAVKNKNKSINKKKGR